MARRPRPPLGVFLNGRIVGRLRRQTSGAIDFRYDDAWLNWQDAIPVSLSLPLREDRYTGAPVVAVFDNLLPDDHDIRRRLAERAGAEGADAYSLLAAVGRDCVGALQFLPDGMEPEAAGALDARPVSDEEVATIIAELGRNPLGVSDGRVLRISLAGAQEKTALLRRNEQWYVPIGTTATTHIIKPAIGRLPNGIDLSRSVENEYFCLALVAALGIPTANAAMADFRGRKALVVERFDRRWTEDGRLLRLPLEDCCQALSVPPSLKYEADGGPGIRDIAELLKGSDTPEADRRVLLKAQMVFWLLGATDGHAKNFSVRLASRGRYRLAPLYDVVSAQPSVDAGEIRKNRMKMAMAVGTSRHYVVDTIAPRHFEQTAHLCGYPAVRTMTEIIDELCGTLPAAVEGVRTRLPHDFPELLVDSIVRATTRRLDVLRRSTTMR